MTSKEGTTQKWVAKFCELMDWFIGLEKVHGDNLMDAHLKGLAANYLAVKLGIFDETKPEETLDPLDREPPYRHGDWECDQPERSGSQQIREWRLARMKHWKRKAEQHGEFRRALVQKEVTQENIRHYCDCLRGIAYQARANPSWADITPLVLEANDLAVKLGLTHPDWILAMDLALLPYFLGADVIRQLPLPWKYDKPPFIFNGHSFVLSIASRQTLPDVEELLTKAQSLSPINGNSENASSAIQKLTNPVTCATVAAIAHKRSDNIARTLRSRRYRVIIEGRKSYCDAEEAAVLWPKWKEHWQEQRNREKS